MQQSELVSILKKECKKRTKEEVSALLSYLQSLDCVSCLPGAALERICQSVGYEAHSAGTVLYQAGDRADCWYILISGNVFIENTMFVPPSNFGKRVECSALRQTDCVILDDSELIVIDYFSSCQKMAESELKTRPLGPGDTSIDGAQLALRDASVGRCMRQVSDDADVCISTYLLNSCSSVPNGGIYDFLKESTVDSDVDDACIETFAQMVVKDAVKDCLDKRSEDRSEEDIEAILDFIQHFPAFSNTTIALRRAMCAVVVYAVVDFTNTVIYEDGQEFDSWSVIINGEVEVIGPDGSTAQLHVGDSFGLQPDISRNDVALNHVGTMYSKADNCQFVCVAKEDFYKILHQGVENTETVEEQGKVVLVTEKRLLKRGNRTGNIVIRGIPEKLILHLVDDQSSADSTYAEDFLLTCRTFLRFPMELAERLVAWLNSDVPVVRDKAVRIALLWVNNHFSDFEFEPRLNDILAKFDAFLTSQALEGQMKLLCIACSAKSHQRKVVLSRPSASKEWPFSIFSWSGTVGLVFVGGVHGEKCKSEQSETGTLLPGDQILRVNDNSTDCTSYKQILELLKSATRLELTVRFNFEAFREAVRNSSVRSEPRVKSSWKVGSLVVKESKPKEMRSDGFPESGVPGGVGIYFSPKKLTKLFRNNFSQKAPSSSDFSTQLPKQDVAIARKLHSSGSHPDLTFVGSDVASNPANQLLTIYGPNQSPKNLLVSKEMTVAQVVAVAVKEFGLQNPSRYCLCQELVTADDKSDVKMTVLRGQVTNVPGAARPDSKFCLISRPTSLDAQLTKGVNEATWLGRYQSSLLPLQPEELAKQLTLRDLLIFRDIESTEYIVDLFGVESNYGTPNLSKFTETINSEMFWVMTEICIERNIDVRAKLIQKFVKIAKLCKDLNNLNSVFFIVSGLSHGSISRLKLTWERVPTKYHKLFANLQELLDPSRNMSNYRNLLNSQLSKTPAIPFFPIVKKDLTFIHLGNDSKVEGLVNFEKLRMVAKEVRRVTTMASAYYCNYSQHNFLGLSSVAGTGSGSTSIPPSTAAFVFGTLRKKKPLPPRLNSRKLLDETQMVQRVKDYLLNLLIIDDEEKLHELSNQLEPSGNVRRKNISPLPPVSSAGTSSGPKFGMNSSQAVQKLMTLTDKVKLHDQRKNPIPPPPPPTILLPDDLRVKASHQRPPNPTLVHLSVESSSVIGSLVNSSDHNNHMTGCPTHDRDRMELEVGLNDHSSSTQLPRHGCDVSDGVASSLSHETPMRSETSSQVNSHHLYHRNKSVIEGSVRANVSVTEDDGDDELSEEEGPIISFV